MSNEPQKQATPPTPEETMNFREQLNRLALSASEVEGQAQYNICCPRCKTYSGYGDVTKTMLVFHCVSCGFNICQEIAM